jgi:hypothetical protein
MHDVFRLAVSLWLLAKSQWLMAAFTLFSSSSQELQSAFALYRLLIG